MVSILEIYPDISIDFTACIFVRILTPSHTGKSFAGLIRMIREGRIKQGEKIIFIHTGGLQGLYTKHHREAFEEELIDGIIVEKKGGIMLPYSLFSSPQMQS